MLLEKAETDWLGSKPVFYNDSTNKVSYKMDEVIDFNHLEFNPEGLRNYLRFGYCVLGLTPFEHVRFLRYSSRIWHDESGKICIEEYEDPVKDKIDKKSDCNDVIAGLKDCVNNWEMSHNKIVLPLSGGYDSKLLLSLISNKDKVYAYSYGYSKKQIDSFEVIRAKKVAELYGVKWEHVQLKDFLKFIPDWNDQYGSSMHAHGMYQMDFYNEIDRRIGHEDTCVLSGIIGDAWAGNVRLAEINNSEELDKLSYSHGMDIHSDICLLPETNDIAESFWNEHKYELENENWRIVYAMRLKIMLLRYLLETPIQIGFDAWSPFLDLQNAMSMLTIPWSQKGDRKWQKEYFEHENIEYGWLKRECDYNMIINESAMRLTRLEPLNTELLSKIVKREFVESINRELVCKPMQSFSAKPRTIPNVINKAIKKYNSSKISALYSYEILYPLQKVMEKSF
ncbi:MAG: hypothetical protein E7308_06530 [Butyrivibrio sp.]|nr:hypothetical protein [Butyrivibrio sp.]